jgi:hypothetical protein
MIAKVYSFIVSRIATILLAAILIVQLFILAAVKDIYFPRPCGSEYNPCQSRVSGTIDLNRATIDELAAALARRLPK